MRYYSCQVLVELDEEMNGIDSGCDEVYALRNYFNTAEVLLGDNYLVDYEPITKEFYDKHKHDIFDEGGGL